MSNILMEEMQDIKSIKKELEKAIKWIDEDISIQVKIFDNFEDGEYGDGQTYDVEINLYINGEYTQGWLNQTFFGKVLEDQLALKDAKKRAKAVLRMVKDWFKYNDDVVVDDEIEVYHV